MKALPVIGVISSRKIGLICLSRHFRNRLARWVFRRSERWSAHIDSHGESGWNPQCSTVCRPRPARLQGKQISSACCRCKRSPGIGWGCRWNSPTVKEDPGGTAHREPPLDRVGRCNRWSQWGQATNDDWNQFYGVTGFTLLFLNRINSISTNWYQWMAISMRPLSVMRWIGVRSQHKITSAVGIPAAIARRKSNKFWGILITWSNRIVVADAGISSMPGKFHAMGA